VELNRIQNEGHAMYDNWYLTQPAGEGTTGLSAFGSLAAFASRSAACDWSSAAYLVAAVSARRALTISRNC